MFFGLLSAAGEARGDDGELATVHSGVQERGVSLGVFARDDAGALTAEVHDDAARVVSVDPGVEVPLSRGVYRCVNPLEPAARIGVEDDPYPPRRDVEGDLVRVGALRRAPAPA